MNWGGILNLALDIRGQDIFLDMVDRPDDVRRFFAGLAAVIDRFTAYVESETGTTSISVNRLVRHLDGVCVGGAGRRVTLFLAERGTVPVPGGRAYKHDPVHVTRGPYPFRLEQWKGYWSAVRCPVLFVEAERSEQPAPPDMEERIACFRDARRAVVAEAGHMMIRHQPEAVARLLLDFLPPS